MNDIKLIVFDLDGTLYNLDDVVAMNYQMQLDFYSAYTGGDKNKIEREFEENNIYPTMTEKSKSATEFFVRNGVSAEEWNTYREDHFDVNAINIETVAKSEVIVQFAAVSKLVLLSSNSMRNIRKILNRIAIKPDFFEDIVCSDHKYGSGPFKKIDEMKLISSKYGINPMNILSIGDRFKTDVEPILELGGIGIVVKGPHDLPYALKALKNNDWSGIKLYGTSPVCTRWCREDPGSGTNVVQFRSN